MAEASVQSVERAFALLERLSARPQGVGLVELSELTGLHKSTTHRLLACLGAMGYVVKDSQSGRYRLTYKLLELSNAMLEDMDVLSVAKPHLDQLSQRTGETVHLMVPEGTQGVYIYKSDTTGQGQMRSKVGLQVPLVVTAAGKAMLATGSDEEARRVWAQSDHTPLTEHRRLSWPTSPGPGPTAGRWTTRRTSWACAVWAPLCPTTGAALWPP